MFFCFVDLDDILIFFLKTSLNTKNTSIKCFNVFSKTDKCGKRIFEVHEEIQFPAGCPAERFFVTNNLGAEVFQWGQAPRNKSHLHVDFIKVLVARSEEKYHGVHRVPLSLCMWQVVSSTPSRLTWTMTSSDTFPSISSPVFLRLGARLSYSGG